MPEGWKAQWNDQYKEWFYVNLYTKQSQWDKPTEPVYSSNGGAPPGSPPNYAQSDRQSLGPEKGGYLASNNPYGGSGSHGGSSNNVVDDEAFARKLQEEENARAGVAAASAGDRGAADSYYGQGQGSSMAPPAPQYGQGAQPDLPARDGKSKGGFLSKLMGKASGSSRPQQGYGYGQQSYQQGPPQGQYGYAPQQGYYGQGGGYPQQGGPYQQQQPAKKHGMGAGGAAALGVGGGLLGGMLLADAMEDHDQGEYQQGVS